MKYGAIFGCISCHIANYIRSVEVFDEKLRAKLEEKYEDSEVFDRLLDEAYHNTTVQAIQTRRYLDIDKDGTGVKEFTSAKHVKIVFERIECLVDAF